jgi:hypothetical protein
MPPFIEALFRKILAFFKDMKDNVLMIYAEKGFEPFKKPLIIAGPTLLVLYAAVYNPLGGRLSVASKELANAEVVAQFSDSYDDAKTKLSAYQRKLPLAKDKDEWLNFILTSTARNYGIAFDGMTAQVETEVGNFVLVSREVTVTTTYAKLGAWVAEIENSPIYLKIVNMTIHKDLTNPGSVKVSFKLSTVFPKFGGGGKS